MFLSNIRTGKVLSVWFRNVILSFVVVGNPLQNWMCCAFRDAFLLITAVQSASLSYFPSSCQLKSVCKFSLDHSHQKGFSTCRTTGCYLFLLHHSVETLDSGVCGNPKRSAEMSNFKTSSLKCTETQFFPYFDDWGEHLLKLMTCICMILCTVHISRWALTARDWCSGQSDHSWGSPAHSAERLYWCVTPAVPASASGFAVKGNKGNTSDN